MSNKHYYTKSSIATLVNTFDEHFDANSVIEMNNTGIYTDYVYTGYRTQDDEEEQYQLVIRVEEEKPGIHQVQIFSLHDDDEDEGKVIVDYELDHTHPGDFKDKVLTLVHELNEALTNQE